MLFEECLKGKIIKIKLNTQAGKMYRFLKAEHSCPKERKKWESETWRKKSDERRSFSCFSVAEQFRLSGKSAREKKVE